MAIERMLPITGYRDRPLPNRLRQPAQSAGRLAILLPGFGYTLDMPLFYYLEYLCLDRGYDVLRVETNYSQNPAFADAAEAERARWVAADARAAWQAGLAQADYGSAVVVGKSLGTMAMAALLDDPVGTTTTAPSIWLTPLLAQPLVRETLLRLGASAQVVIGDADPHHDAAVLADLQDAGVNVVVAPGADHGLDIPGDAPGSARLMSQILTAVQEFGFR